MSDSDVPGPTGRAISGRFATILGIGLGLLLVIAGGTAFALLRDDAGTAPVVDEHDHEDHIEADPRTGEPLEDPCEDTPEMCGENTGDVGGDPCSGDPMCGTIQPDGGTELDLSGEPCEDELCGDVGPGQADDTGP